MAQESLPNDRKSLDYGERADTWLGEDIYPILALFCFSPGLIPFPSVERIRPGFLLENKREV